MSYRRYSLSGGATDPYGVGAGRYGTSYGSASKYGSTSPVTTSVPSSRPRWGGGPGLGGGTCYTSLPSTKPYSSRENVGSGYSSSGGGSGYGSLGRSYGYNSLPASDAGSTRSLGSALSSRSYGSGNLNRQYTDVGTSGHYSPHDSSSGYRSKPLDRSLSYVGLNSGSVGNLKDRFDRPSSSRDRYSSLERLSSRDGDYGGKASGYMSDVGSSRPYGSWDRSQRAPSVSRTFGSYSRETSPVRSTTKSSRYHSSTPKKYGGGGMDFGTSYSARPKSSADTVTPSYARSRSTDLTLMPYSSRTRTSSFSGYDRQPSVDRSIRASVDRQIPTYTRQTSRESTYSKPTVQRKPAVQNSEESSESVSESEEKKDQNYRYLVSRGTEPMDTAKERERESRRFKQDKKSISRTKKKKVPTATLR